MDIDIIQITEKISIVVPGISPGWPAFAAWISTQVPKRTITGQYDGYERMLGWSDQWKSGGEQKSREREFQEAVLSSEVVGVLRAPPMSLSKDESISARNHLISIGLLVAHRFLNQRPCYAIIQFRV